MLVTSLVFASRLGNPLLPCPNWSLSQAAHSLVIGYPEPAPLQYLTPREAVSVVPGRLGGRYLSTPGLLCT